VVSCRSIAVHEEASRCPDPAAIRLIRVDMTKQTVKIEPFPDAWKLLGGRGLSARILVEECDATATRSARQRARDGARRALGYRRADVGPDLDRRQEPATEAGSRRRMRAAIRART
jgi:hypothetical protein